MYAVSNVRSDLVSKMTDVPKSVTLSNRRNDLNTIETDTLISQYARIWQATREYRSVLGAK
jgi:hypothetical protein